MKVIARIKGGLGNQLFCYCAARRLAIVNNAELVIDNVTGFRRDCTYKRVYALQRFHVAGRIATSAERMEPFERYRRALAKAISRRRPFKVRSYIEQEGLDFDPRILDIKARDVVYLDGYWQSEGYFKDVEPDIRSDLTMTPPTDQLNTTIAAEMKREDSVAVHVRWFDDPDKNIPVGYYQTAIQEVIKRVTRPHFYIFSDKEKLALGKVPLSENQTTLIAHNKHDPSGAADLWLMAQCKHFIIANSTFSWWGAWLSANASKLVIAPAGSMDGITAWGFKGLIPTGWLLV